MREKLNDNLYDVINMHTHHSLLLRKQFSKFKRDFIADDISDFPAKTTRFLNQTLASSMYHRQFSSHVDGHNLLQTAQKSCSLLFFKGLPGPVRTAELFLHHHPLSPLFPNLAKCGRHATTTDVKLTKREPTMRRDGSNQSELHTSCQLFIGTRLFSLRLTSRVHDKTSCTRGDGEPEQMADDKQTVVMLAIIAKLSLLHDHATGAHPKAIYTFRSKSRNR